MNITVIRNSCSPMYIQISRQISGMIMSGQLPAGYRLPPERILAQRLDVNRTTILNAYRELKAEGLVESHVGRGTVVMPVNAGSSKLQASGAGQDMVYTHLYSPTGTYKEDGFVKMLLEAANRKDIISLAAGIPNPDVNPVNEIQQIQKELFQKHGNTLFHHVPADGLPGLKKNLQKLCAEKNIRCRTNEIMVTSGSQQGINLAARLFISPGDTVVTEDPTYIMARDVFRSMGANIIGIPVDSDGMKTDVLESVLKRTRPKFIYTIPDYHNPTGSVMSGDRKASLLSLARSHQLLIIEDGAYSELVYGAERPVPVRSMDDGTHVVYLGTFSKVLFMGLRIGWMCAPAELINRMSEIKLHHDLHSGSLAQWIISGLLESGVYAKHRKNVISMNNNRRKAMLAALEKYKPEKADISWTIPTGGLYVWVRLPGYIDSDVLFRKAVEAGVAFVPGRMFSAGSEDNTHIRLNFTYCNSEAIDEGIKLLMDTIKAYSGNYANDKDLNQVKPIL